MGFEQIPNEQAWRGNRQPGIQEGADFEKAVLGRAILKGGAQPEYLSYDKAIAYAKEHQPGLAERAETARNLRIKVAEYADPNEPVHFYTAVGTPLDICHGVDAFFEQGSRRATVDVSLREKENYKADVLIVGALDEDGNVDIRDEALSRAAAQIASKLAK